MVKHIQTIRRLLPTKFLSVFDHFVGLARKGLIDRFIISWKISFILKWCRIEQSMTWSKLPRRKTIFTSFQFVVLSLIALDN